MPASVAPLFAPAGVAEAVAATGSPVDLALDVVVGASAATPRTGRPEAGPVPRRANGGD